VELTELYLRRIESLDPRLNAYLTVCGDEVLAAAREAEAAVMRGEELPPLHGVPISIKDLELTKGVRTTLGSLIFKDRVPDRDSVVVERVRRAGVVILGKTNTPEFGLYARTENRLGEPCRNPWNIECTTGGSSGGAGAALAAGLCPLAIGSDGGGSIRIPSAFCGVFGIKPSQGRVPRAGGYGGPEPNQFAQSGPMANTVRDAALLLGVLSGPDPRDPIPSMRVEPPDFVAALEGGVEGLRMGWSPDLGYGAVDPEVERITYDGAKVFEGLGCSVEAADITLGDHHWEHFWNIFTANDYAAYGDLLEERADELTDYARDALERGRSVTGAQYARSVRDVFELRLQFDQVMERYDLLLTPTASVPAFPPDSPPTTIADRKVHPFWGFFPYTFPVNMVGQPAATVPCGFSSQGLPLGLHIVGRRGDDALVLRAAAAFEQARPWAGRRPPVS